MTRKPRVLAVADDFPPHANGTPTGGDPSELDGIVAGPATPGRFVLLQMPPIHAIARTIDGGRLDRRTRLLGPIHLDVDKAAACRQIGMEEVVEVVRRVTRRESLRPALRPEEHVR